MYNLLDQPFIRAFYPDGSQKELGIKDVFSEAPNISRIGGDSPQEEVALLRLLLAVIYRAVEVDDVQDWEELWNDGLPISDIHHYLESYRERFELLDSDTPFYQILGAEYVKDQAPKNEFLLLSHSLYGAIKNDGLDKLDFPFCARQLVALQSFNTASKKSPIVGDPRKKKYGYAQPGWLANGSTVHALGKNLEQTLILNFVPYDELEIDRDEDLPVWEREPQTAIPEGLHGDMDESRIPGGPADLYTHQSTRITLYHDGEHVTGTVAGIGDRLFKYNMRAVEPMMAWREIKRETKELAFVPVKQTEGKDSWRSLNALLGHNENVKLSQSKPRTFTWLTDSRIREMVNQELGLSIPTVVTSVFYGPQDAIISNTEVSILDLSTDILKENSASMVTALKALSIAETSVYYYSNLIANLLVAEGKEKSPSKGTKAIDIAKNHTHEILRELSSAYQEWVSEVTDTNALDKLEAWNDTVFRITKNLGDKTVENSSIVAIAGRVKGDNPMNSAVASNIFNGMLSKEYKNNARKEEV